MFTRLNLVGTVLPTALALTEYVIKSSYSERDKFFEALPHLTGFNYLTIFFTKFQKLTGF